jgi:hypothetical protein
MTLIDEEDRKQSWLGVVAFALLMLMAAFGMGAWSSYSDAKAAQSIAAEKCEPGEVAFVRQDGAQTLCLKGSQRAGGARR